MFFSSVSFLFNFYIIYILMIDRNYLWKVWIYVFPNIFNDVYVIKKKSDLILIYNTIIANYNIDTGKSNRILYGYDYKYDYDYSTTRVEASEYIDNKIVFICIKLYFWIIALFLFAEF